MFSVGPLIVSKVISEVSKTDAFAHFYIFNKNGQIRRVISLGIDRVTNSDDFSQSTDSPRGEQN